MDVRRFTTEPWIGESENPDSNELSGLIWSQGFSLVTFFGPAKKVTRRKAEACDVRLSLFFAQALKAALRAKQVQCFTGFSVESRAARAASAGLSRCARVHFF